MKHAFIFLALLTLHLHSYSQSYLGYAINGSELVDTNYVPLKHIPKGDALFLISLETQQGYYNVIHIKSNKEGFVPRKHVAIERVVPQVESNIFTSIQSSEAKDPIIKIQNSSKFSMTIKLNNQVIELLPKEKKTVHLSRGKYFYRVSAQNIEPYYGEEVLDNFHLYEWEFYIGDM